MLPTLPNNRLILNGHKIHNESQLFAYISKRLKLNQNIDSLEMMAKILGSYKDLQIAVRHGDTFLQEEKLVDRALIFAHLEKCGPVKVTGKK